MHGARGAWLVYAALALAVAVVYSPVQDHEFINYDDPDYITANAQVVSGLTWSGVGWAFTSSTAANWHPLTWLSHMLDCQIFGLSSGAHHLMNVVLHGVNALLLFGLLLRLTGARWRSAFVAFLFALHPLHVESVAWAAERKDVLAALFWLLTMLAYVNYTQRRSTLWYGTMLVGFACGLMSKPMVVTLPFVLLLIDFWPLGRFGRTPARRLIGEKIPLVALSIASSIVTFLVQRAAGAVAASDAVPFMLRAQNAIVAYGAYLANLFWPANLAVVYPFTPPGIIATLLAAALIAAVTFFAWREVSRMPYLMAGWLWYLGTLVPVIGLVQAGVQARADRYTYIPMIGIAIMLAWGAVELFQRRGWNQRVLAGIGIAACAAWGVASSKQLEYWHDSVRLFQHAIDVTTGNYIAHANLGAALRGAGDIAGALPHFEETVKLHPLDAQSQENLGEALLALDRAEAATAPLSEAIKLRPDYTKAYIDLGSAFMKAGKPDQAAAAFQAALRRDPDNAGVNYGVGTILLARGQRNEARPYLEKALPQLIDTVRRQPAQPDAHFNLAALYEALGRFDEAIAEFTATLRLRPEDAEARAAVERLRAQSPR